MEPQVTNNKARRPALPEPPAEAACAAVHVLPGAGAGGGAVSAQILN